MELAGLEPAASWVRYGNAIVRARRRFRAIRPERRSLESRPGGAQIAGDHRGLRSIRAPETVWCPIHLSVGRTSLDTRTTRLLLFARSDSEPSLVNRRSLFVQSTSLRCLGVSWDITSSDRGRSDRPPPTADFKRRDARRACPGSRRDAPSRPPTAGRVRSPVARSAPLQRSRRSARNRLDR
jgi:hypothetical protein